MPDRGASGYSGKGPLHPALSRPPPSSERYPSEARRRPRGAATGSRGSTFPEEDEGRAILKRRRVEERDRMRKRGGVIRALLLLARFLPSFTSSTPQHRPTRHAAPSRFRILSSRGVSLLFPRKTFSPCRPNGNT